MQRVLREFAVSWQGSQFNAVAASGNGTLVDRIKGRAIDEDSCNLGTRSCLFFTGGEKNYRLRGEFKFHYIEGVPPIHHTPDVGGERST
jgi:hypothetical protein